MKNISCQNIFNENTSSNPRLIEVLQNSNIFKDGAKWIKQLNHLIAISFKKIRMSNSTPKMDRKIMALLKQREHLKSKISYLKTDDVKGARNYKHKMEDVENEIADIKAEEYLNVIKEHVGHLIDDTENFNCIKMWTLKKKMCPVKAVKPVAKKNKTGELVTKPDELKKLYESTYKSRLSHRVMKPELSRMYDLKMQLFNLRLQVSQNLKSKKWTKENLLQVLKILKKNKSADPHGLIYILFRPEVIGSDLFTSLLMFCNSVKE